MKKFDLQATGKKLLLLTVYAGAWVALDVFLALISRPDTVIGLVFTLLWAFAFEKTGRLGGKS